MEKRLKNIQTFKQKTSELNNDLGISALHKTDISKSFYCTNEKRWLDKCKEQCMSCAVEMIRTQAQ